MPKVKDTMTNSLLKMERKIKQIPNKAYRYWLGITPIKTGNARRKTSLQNNVIKAGYNYASFLDKGWSKQAPNGMIKPTKKYIDGLMKNIMRK